MGNKVRSFMVVVLVVLYCVSVAAGDTGDPDEDRRIRRREEQPDRRPWREDPEGGARRRRPEEEYPGRRRPEEEEYPGLRPEEEEYPGRRRREEGEEYPGRRRPEHYPPKEDEEGFLLSHSKSVVETDAGHVRVVKSAGGRIVDKPMDIGFITMEPKSLFIPQYLDSSLIIFIFRGEAKIGLIYEDTLGERRLKSGDVYRIPAGSSFYLVNTGEGQRLHIVCSIDKSESLGLSLQSFFIGGGNSPQSVLAGFGHDILKNAFNVSSSDISELLTRQDGGPIVFVPNAHSPSVWSNFLNLNDQDRLQQMKKMVGIRPDSSDDDQSDSDHTQQIWSWRKLLNFVFGHNSDEENKRSKKDIDDGKGKGKSPDSYNLYDRNPDFRNNYGWSMELDETDYAPLKHSGVGVYLVNLTAGAMMAPHVNPTATEYGIVLRGSGTIQIVYPNGTLAINTEVQEGDVFWVPRYFPFCQIASRTGAFEFFGFTTSARKNRPQFLVGASSVLQELRGPELALAFGVTEERLRKLINAQREAVILPSAQAAPPYKESRKTPKEEKEKEERKEEKKERKRDARVQK